MSHPFSCQLFPQVQPVAPPHDLVSREVRDTYCSGKGVEEFNIEDDEWNFPGEPTHSPPLGVGPERGINAEEFSRHYVGQVRHTSPATCGFQSGSSS